MQIKTKGVLERAAGFAPLAAFLVGIAGMAVLAVILIAPPALPRGAEGEAYRALLDPAKTETAAYLATGAAHPAGSPEDERMRRAIEKDLEAAGYGADQIRIDAFTHANRDMRGKPLRGNRPALPLRNLVVEIKGSAPSPGAGRILVVCHYDSTGGGPGAGDDGFGTLACIGALRSLRTMKSLKNDLTFLFADGEEAGLYGSSAAAERAGMAEGTSLVINMEGLEKGIVIPLEFSKPDGRALDTFLSAFPRPYVAGVILDIFSILPFGTDLNEFEEKGVGGVTLAPLSVFANYHGPKDSLDSLDPRSLAQASSGLTRMILRLDEKGAAPGGRDLIAQSLLPGITLSYPSRLSWLAILLPWIAFIILLAFALAKGRLKIRAVLASLGLSLLALIAGIALSYVVQRLLGSPGDSSQFYRQRGIPHPGFNLLMALLAPAAVAAIIAFLARKPLRGTSGAAGALLFPLAAASLLAAFLPRSGPLLLLPAAASVLAFGLGLLPQPSPALRSLCSFLVGASYALMAAGFLVIANTTLVVMGMAPAVALFPCFAILAAAPYLAGEKAEAAPVAPDAGA